MGESIIGQEPVIEQLIIGLLANGNILMEGKACRGWRKRGLLKAWQ